VLGSALAGVVGVLSESSVGRDVVGSLDVEWPATKGDVFIAVPVREGSAILSAVTAYLDLLRHEGGQEGAVIIRGDRARETRRERLASGIPTDRRLWDDVKSLGSRMRDRKSTR